MYTYSQNSGMLVKAGKLLATGYSGHGACRNDSAAQAVPRLGPLPQGVYSIARAVDSAHLGPLALPLLPHPGNVMYGRTGFYIHGDNQQCNHTASEGCIILPRAVREQLAASDDTSLTVVP